MPGEVHDRVLGQPLGPYRARRLAPRDAGEEHDVVASVGERLDRHPIHTVGTLHVGLQPVGVEQRFDVGRIALNADRALILQHDRDGMLGHDHAAPRAAQLAERLNGFGSGLETIFAHKILSG